MKKLLLVLAILALPLAAVAESWTLMVWLNNQNNLKTYGWDDFNEMEDCDYSAYPDGVDVIVMLGWDPNNDSKLFHVETDPGGYSGGDYSDIVSTEITGHGIWSGDEADMDDPQIFENFVGWVTANYPADNFLISAWDHGGGIFLEDDIKDWIDKGMCSDLKIWEIEEALENVGEFIDIIGFDVCLGGQIENGYQYLDNVGICIASEDNEPGDGWDYQAFNIFEEDSAVTPEELATRIVDDYLEFYGSGVTQAAQDVKNWSNLESDWAELCQMLFDYCYVYESQIIAARSSADYWNTSNDRDLYQFVSTLANDASLPGDLQSKASDVVSGLESYIVAGGMHNPLDPGDGMAIYFPSNGPDNPNWNTYTTLINFSDTLWDEFLEMYADPYPSQPIMIDLDSVTFDDSVGGNGDGELDPGETIDVTVTLKNDGTEAADGVTATMTIDDAYFIVSDGSGDFGSIPSGGTASDDFQFIISSFCPNPYTADADLAISADGGYTSEASFEINVDDSSDIGSVAFTGESVNEGVLLSWTPDNPTEITGANVLRETEGRYTRLNDSPLTGSRYLDMDIIPAERYLYKLEVLGVDGSTKLFGPVEVVGSSEGGLVTTLEPCYPCPADEGATIPFNLADEGRVRIEVYDLAGRLVDTLVDGEMAAGRHEVRWSTDRIANGVYLIRLTSGSATATRRLIISR